MSEQLNDMGYKAQTAEGSQSIPPFVVLTPTVQRADDRKKVRVFRGIVSSEPSIIMNQASYALRETNNVGDVEVREDLKPLVFKLASEPSYKNLLVYYYALMASVHDGRKRKELERELREIEDGILSGHSTRTCLTHSQITHGGGWPDMGLTPYIVTSWDAREAVTYTGGRGVLLVIDLPIDRLGHARFGSETGVSAMILPDEIAAIIPINSRHTEDTALETALTRVSDVRKVYPMSNTSLQREKERLVDEHSEFDSRQEVVDLEQVRAKRTGETIEAHPEIRLTLEQVLADASSAEKDVYTYCKELVFDYWSKALAEVGINPFSYGFTYRPAVGNPRPYSKEKIDEEMLQQLRQWAIEKTKAKDAAYTSR